MADLKMKIKAVALSALVTLGAGACAANGADVQSKLQEHRQKGLVEQVDSVEQKEIDHLVALIDRSEHQPSPNDAQSRGVQTRELDTLFGACTRTFDKASDVQRKEISDGIESLFTNNDFAANRAATQLSGQLCGVDIPDTLHR